MPQYRAEFDATIAFTNGGSLTAEGFRVDVPGPDVTTDDVATLLVKSLGLLMSGPVEVRSLRVFEEPHKGTRGGPSSADAAAPADQWSVVELSHVITPGMTTYPGLPGPVITPYLSREDSRRNYAEGTEFEIDKIELVGNTGTYLDSPFHRYADGVDLAGLPLTSSAHLPCVVVRTTGSSSRAVDVGELAAHEVAGRAVLLHTGGDRFWGRPEYAQDAPFLTERGARWLADEGAVLVGIDAVNIDDVQDPRRPAHSILLAAGIPVVEHLRGLDQVPPTGAVFTAAPPRLAACGTFPVRAFAAIPVAQG